MSTKLNPPAYWSVNYIQKHRFALAVYAPEMKLPAGLEQTKKPKRKYYPYFPIGKPKEKHYLPNNEDTVANRVTGGALNII